jgi:predicted nucleic acid-binding protein
MLAVQSSQALLADGLRLHERYRLSWYDSLIIAAALEAECGVLYSEDLQHGQTFGHLRIDNPFR